MRTPSSQKCRLDLAPPLADRFILGVTPSITARYFSSGPSDSTLRWTPCPPEVAVWWLQVRLGCIQLSLSCPFRLLHTFLTLRPARHYSRFWIRRSSSERRRDLNPPDLHAAQRTLRTHPPPHVASPVPHGLQVDRKRGHHAGFPVLLGSSPCCLPSLEGPHRRRQQRRLLARRQDNRFRRPR